MDIYGFLIGNRSEILYLPGFDFTKSANIEDCLLVKKLESGFISCIYEDEADIYLGTSGYLPPEGIKKPKGYNPNLLCLRSGLEKSLHKGSSLENINDIKRIDNKIVIAGDRVFEDINGNSMLNERQRPYFNQKIISIIPCGSDYLLHIITREGKSQIREYDSFEMEVGSKIMNLGVNNSKSDTYMTSPGIISCCRGDYILLEDKKIEGTMLRKHEYTEKYGALEIISEQPFLVAAAGIGLNRLILFEIDAGRCMTKLNMNLLKGLKSINLAISAVRHNSSHEWLMENSRKHDLFYNAF